MRKIELTAVNAPVVLSCWIAMMALLYAVAGIQTVQAQETGLNEMIGAKEATSANKGTLNFVDADIESVIAAIGDYTNTTFIIDPRIKGKINLVSESRSPRHRHSNS